MDCTTAREALSARLDDELSPVMEAALDSHLETCVACTGLAAGMTRATRRARLQAAPEVADLAPAVVAQVSAIRRSPWSPARYGLVVVAVAQVSLSVPMLLGASVGADEHTSREVGVTELALAVGLLAAAWRPWRAAGMVPVVVALAVGLAVISGFDILIGQVRAVHELPHLLPLAGALLLWQVRHREPLPLRPHPAAAPGSADLRRSA